MADFDEPDMNFLVVCMRFIVSGFFALFWVIVSTLVWATGVVNVGLVRLQQNHAMPTMVSIKIEHVNPPKRVERSCEDTCCQARSPAMERS